MDFILAAVDLFVMWYSRFFVNHSVSPKGSAPGSSGERVGLTVAKDKCRISRHRVEVDQIAINLDGTTIVDTTINPLLLYYRLRLWP